LLVDDAIDAALAPQAERLSPSAPPPRKVFVDRLADERGARTSAVPGQFVERFDLGSSDIDDRAHGYAPACDIVII
jgi:hypothetical protein